MIPASVSTTPSIGAWVVPALPPGIEPNSIHLDSKVEADRYKWIRSEEAGHDVGEVAIKHWVRDHWHGYLRTKWLEHLQGKTFWIELRRCAFGLLQQECENRDDLLNRVIDKLKLGQENLGVIQWAVLERLPLPLVHRILAAVDVNSCHLVHQFDSQP